MHQWLLLAQEDGGAFMAGGCILVSIILGVVGFVIWLWALISAIKNPALDSTMRLVWILVIVFTGFIGAIIYLLIGAKTTGATGPGQFDRP